MVVDQAAHLARQGASDEGFEVEQADDGDRLAADPDVQMRSLVAHGVGEVDLEGDRPFLNDGRHFVYTYTYTAG